MELPTVFSSSGAVLVCLVFVFLAVLVTLLLTARSDDI
jgi:hypothetical protein